MGMNAGMDAAAGMGAGAGLGAAGIVTILKYVLITLGAGVLLGAFFGLVFAGIKYPNPNKRALFSPIQKIIVIVVAIVGMTMIIYAFTKKPGSEVPVGGGTSMGQMVDENGMPMADNPTGDGTDVASDGEATDSESSEESSEAESSAASSTATPPTVTANATAPKVGFRSGARGGIAKMG